MIIVRNGENAAAFCVVTNGKVVGYYDRQKFDVSGVEWNDTSKCTPSRFRRRNLIS